MTNRLEKQTPLRHKLIAATISTALSALIAVWYLGSREPASVELVDMRAQIDALLAEQLALGAEPLPLFDAEGHPITARRRLKPRIARRLFPMLDRRSRRAALDRDVYDRWSYFRNRSDLRFERRFREHPRKEWLVITNGLGFREYDEVRAAKPALRILVTGDSHTEGVVPNEESFTNVLEQMLAQRREDDDVEALNAGKGGYSFFNYPGVLEKHADRLAPDVFVIGVFGGNDFYEAASQLRFFNRLPPPERDPALERRIRALGRTDRGAAAQALNQATRFTFSPEEVTLALHASTALSLEASDLSRQRGIRFLVVYIPSFVEVQPHLLEKDLQPLLDIVEITDEDLDVLATVGDRYLAALSELDIEAIDMRPVFRRQQASAYWQSDHHINTLGHRLIAAELAARLEKGTS